MWAEVLGASALGAAACLPMIGVPIVWAHAGDPAMAALLDPVMPVWATAACTGWLAALGLAQAKLGEGPRSSPLPALGAALLVGPALAGLTRLLGGTDGSWQRDLVVRGHDLLAPGAAGLAPALLLILADELLFRHVILRRVGLVGAAVAWWLARCPLDPVTGLVSGLALAALGRSGLAAPLVARLGWLIAALLLS